MLLRLSALRPEGAVTERGTAGDMRGKLRTVNAESDHKNTPLQSGGQEVNFSQYVRKTEASLVWNIP